MTEFHELLDPGITRLCQTIKEARCRETTRCAIHELYPPLTGFAGELHAVFNGDLTPILDQFAVLNSLKPLGARWVEVDEETARWILARSLSRGLAYKVEIMSEADARQFVQRVVSACARGSDAERHRFFTNGKAVDGPTMYDVHLTQMTGWSPATDATFDTGVLMVTRRRIGLLWVEDED